MGCCGRALALRAPATRLAAGGFNGGLAPLPLRLFRAFSVLRGV